MAKHTYKAVCPDGTIVTRTTDRKYTHVIVARDRVPDARRPAGERYFQVTWAGTPELAEKAYQQTKNKEFKTFSGVQLGKKARRTGELIYKDVKKIEVG